MNISNSYFSLNPYRLLGVPANSGLKAIHKNLSKLKAFAQLNKKITFDYDLTFLNLAYPERNSDAVAKVESRILLDENKIKFGLFWFYDVTPVDSIALANLIEGNSKKALDIWSKVIKSQEVSAKNISAINNLSTLLLFLSLDETKMDRFSSSDLSMERIRKAVNLKYLLIKSSFFLDFCNNLGINISLGQFDIQTFFTETVLELLNASFTNENLIFLTKGLDSDFKDVFSIQLVKKPLDDLEYQLKKSSELLKENSSSGVLIGKNLIKETLKSIKYLKDTLGSSNYQYELIVDKLANQILQCGIVFFNHNGDDQAYLSSYKYALGISVNEKTIDRAKECIEHCIEVTKEALCWFCEINQVKEGCETHFQMHKWEPKEHFLDNRSYSFFKDGGLQLGRCQSCYNIHNESVVIKAIKFFKGEKQSTNKANDYNSKRRHPMVLKKIIEGYEPGLPS